MPRQPIAIPRQRLIEPLATAQVAVVEASGGYGKTTLARQLGGELGIACAVAELAATDTDARGLLARLERALRRAGLSDLAATVSDGAADPDDLADDLLVALGAETEPVLLVIDDAHHLRDQDAGDVLVRLGDALPHAHRLLVLTRHVRPPIDRVADRAGVVRLRAADLAFTDAEVASLLERSTPATDAIPGVVQAVQRASAGWPAAAALLVAELMTDPGGAPVLDADRPSLLSRLLDDRLAVLSPERRADLRRLAALPELSPSLLAEVTGDDGLFDALVAAGVPIAEAPGGWWRIPDPVRERLADPIPDPAMARRAAEAYRRRDEVELATRVLVAAGLADDAAAHLAGLSPREVERLDLRTMRSLVRTIPDASLALHPRVWLHLARACDAAADGSTRSAALGAAAAVADLQEDAPFRRELDAERARDLARDGAADAAELLATQVVASATPDETLTRVRALHTLGRVRAWRADAPSLAEAEVLLSDVVRMYRDLGMPGWSAHAALSLAYHVHHPRGEASAALDRLDEALAGLVGRQRLRAVLLTFRAEILIANGRAPEAVAADDEARAIGTALGDPRVLAYAAWNEARAASQAGDADGTLERLVEVDRHPGDWSAHPTGVEFLADAAVLADRVGATAAAARYLASARARADEAPQAVLVAEAVVDARSGDPAAALAAFEALDRSDRLETRDRWWLALMRAFAAVRRGDADADARAASAFGLARAIDPGLPFVREPVIAAALQARLAGSLPPHVPRVDLRILGASELTLDGRPVPVPPGRPAAILEMVALADGVSVDEIIDRLWPEVDAETGRARLRNTLNRLRDAIGPVVERQGESLRLTPTTGVDARRYEVAARTATDLLRTHDRPATRWQREGQASDGSAATGAMAAARMAVALYAGPLLPSRLYDDWATEPRERLVRLQLELVDRLAGFAARAGDLDDAIRLRRLGTSLDPDDDVRHVELARLLLAQGRRGSARAALEAAVGVLRSLGLSPTPEMEALRRTIGR